MKYHYKDLNLKTEVGIAIKVRRQVASLAAQPFINTELYMHVLMHITIMHQPIANR